MIGELTSNEILAFSIIKENLDSFYFRINDPEDQNKSIDLTIFPKQKAKIKVEIINNYPYITYENKFIGRIHSLDNNSKYLDKDKLNKLSDITNKQLKSLITNYLYKTSIQYKSDINGFGDYSKSNFLTIPEFNNYNWLNNYSKSVFNIKIDTLIESSILLTET